MLYTAYEPTSQGDRIRLFPSLAAFRTTFGNRAAFEVAVRYDPGDRRLYPLWTHPFSFDPTWSTPAQLHADGSVTARAPIPEVLFAQRNLRTRPALV